MIDQKGSDTPPKSETKDHHEIVDDEFDLAEGRLIRIRIQNHVSKVAPTAKPMLPTPE